MITTPTAVFTCVTEPAEPFLSQSARLLLSLRWFGGTMAEARFVLGTTGELSSDALAFFEQHGGEIVRVPRHPLGHGHSNKVTLMGSSELAGQDTVVLLDCDTLVVQDPSPWLSVDSVSAKIADLPTVTSSQLAEVFARLDIPFPEQRWTHKLTGDACISYCNSGVIIVNEKHRAVLARAWDHWNCILLQRDEPCFRRFQRGGNLVHFTEQTSLAVALATTTLPFQPLPDEMNIPAHLEAYPESWQTLDPVIIHYHWLVYPSGYLKTNYLAQCSRRIESFNERLQADDKARLAIANISRSFAGSAPKS